MSNKKYIIEVNEKAAVQFVVLAQCWVIQEKQGDMFEEGLSTVRWSIVPVDRNGVKMSARIYDLLDEAKRYMKTRACYIAGSRKWKLTLSRQCHTQS